MLVGQLTAELGWGLLVISDARADFQELPAGFDHSGDSREPFVACSDSAVVRVLHGQDGSVTTRVWVGADELERHGACALGLCDIRLNSGNLVAQHGRLAR